MCWNSALPQASFTVQNVTVSSHDCPPDQGPDQFVYTLTDPPVKALGKVIKPVRIGNVSLDLSVLVLFIGLQVLQSLVRFIPF